MSKKEKTKEVKKDIKKYSSLEALQNTDGGKLLMTALKTDIGSCLDEISTKYKTASHAELLAVCAKFAANLALFRSIFRSSKNKKLALEELNAILEESEEDEE